MTRDRTVSGRQRLVVAAALLGVACLSLWARASVPVRVEALSHDDLLFARLAGSLLDGQWLGTFDSLTLAKGPGYPLFIAAAYELGIPLKLAEQAVQLAAATLLAWGASRLTGRPLLGVALFVVVALDPAYLGGEAARLNRTGLYASASTALLGALLLAASLARRRPSGARAVPLVVVAGLAVGLSALGCVLTREEGVTLVPTVLAAGFAALWSAGVRRPGATWRDRRGVAARLAPVLAVAVLASGTVWTGVAVVEHRNEQEYGFAVVTDFADSAFPRLYAALSAVDVGEQRRFVPISRAQREAAYAASPAFAEVRFELEGYARIWIESGCIAVDVCDDYAAGWVPWAIRGAVLRTLGEERTAPAVQGLMAAAADEVSAGCGRSYPCRPVVSSFLPDPSAVPVGDLAAATALGSAQVLTYDAPGHRALRPADEQEYAAFARVVRGLPDDRRVLDRLAASQSAWADVQTAAFGLLTWAALLPALVGLLWWRDRGQRPLQVLAAVLAVAAATRIGLIALVDVTSFPAVGTGYVLPAVDPAAALVLVGCASLLLVLSSRRRDADQLVAGRD
jgi:hypothetical protein